MGEFPAEISRKIWAEKYRFISGGAIRDATLDDTWRRVASALAAAERPDVAPLWAERFHEALRDFKFLPGGRILAGAGTSHRVTLFNCFVMGPVEDSIAGIFDALKESAVTMQQGGGIGLDFSPLRPRGMPVRQVGGTASGPLSFMHVWDCMCSTILSTGARRGAMMATLRCDHPDIEAFVDAKRDPAALRHFNLSVLVSDAFIAAVDADEPWPLLFPIAPGEDDEGEVVTRDWSGAEGVQRCRVVKRVSARSLWERLMRAAYDCAEPGVIFVDHVNCANNLWYCEHLGATNPCGEIPLPPYGACDLGSINLTRFVREPFGTAASVDLEGIERIAETATRLLDNVYDVSLFPLPQQEAAARATRRIGLGITGLADALTMLGVAYGSRDAFEMAASVMARICHAAYRTSIALAKEKGAFPAFDAERYLQSPFVNALPKDIRQGISRYGIRNSHLTAIAPTGTISLFAGNVSSALEPVYAWRYRRTVRAVDGSLTAFDVEDYAHARFRSLNGAGASLPTAFVTAADLSPDAHLGMQAALQAHVDNAISKTITVCPEMDFDAFAGIYRAAHRLGLKGCTAFRPNPVTGQVLTEQADAPERRCCSTEREAD